MNNLMTRAVFFEQLSEAQAYEPERAEREHERLRTAGHTAIIFTLPIGEDLDMTSFWIDIAGKATKQDSIGPYVKQINDQSVHGIALWR